MAIPEAQLVTWCNQGATATAESTHTSIRYALEIAATSRVSSHEIEIFLQGSYRNFTNIRADSDIDVVALLKETYTADASRLVEYQRQAQQQSFAQSSPAPYPWETFRRDVLESLRQHYGPAMVQQGNKAIRVSSGNGRLAADVVPAVVHKLYTSYGTTLLTPEVYIEGISFWDQAASRQIINYPKEHIKNGQAKNADLRTNGNYKPTVRMFKNARRYLVERGRLPGGVAPSYFVECLMYNIPDDLFGNSRQDTMRGIFEGLMLNNMNLFWCQNGQVLLFGQTPEQWNLANARQFVGALIDMWNKWPV